MGPFTSPSLRHRPDHIEWIGREETLLELPPLFQSIRLELGRSLEAPVVAACSRVRAHRRNRVGDRRHAGSETRPDGLRNRNASRPSDVEQGQDDHQLGTRLGCAVSGDPTSRVGSHEGLQFALLLSPLPQPPRVEKRKEEDAEAGSHATQASCQAAKATKSPEWKQASASDPTRIGRGNGAIGGRLVARSRVHGDW